MSEAGDIPSSWRIFVRGASPTARQRAGGAGEAKWRNVMRDGIRDAYPNAPYEPAPGIEYTVEIVFRMTDEELLRPAVDLDNLAKPVLDTVFTSANVSKDRPTGELLLANDTWVFELHLKKVRVVTTEERGADISVSREK